VLSAGIARSLDVRNTLRVAATRRAHASSGGNSLHVGDAVYDVDIAGVLDEHFARSADGSAPQVGSGDDVVR
jgi:hypothetical protein